MVGLVLVWFGLRCDGLGWIGFGLVWFGCCMVGLGWVGLVSCEQLRVGDRPERGTNIAAVPHPTPQPQPLNPQPHASERKPHPQQPDPAPPAHFRNSLQVLNRSLSLRASARCRWPDRRISFTLSCVFLPSITDSTSCVRGDRGRGGLWSGVVGWGGGWKRVCDLQKGWQEGWQKGWQEGGKRGGNQGVANRVAFLRGRFGVSAAGVELLDPGGVSMYHGALSPGSDSRRLPRPPLQPPSHLNTYTTQAPTPQRPPPLNPLPPAPPPTHRAPPCAAAACPVSAARRPPC